jgi:hypothetical protein
MKSKGEGGGALVNEDERRAQLNLLEAIMADRVSVAIKLGGTLPRALLAKLETAITDDGASIDWEGSEFVVAELPADEALSLMANEVAWGRFEAIEQFCRNNQLIFARWAGGCPGSFGPERVVFDGMDETTFAVTDDDEVMISREDVRRLGSIASIETYFAAADLAVPPLVIVDDILPEGGDHG